MADDPPRAPHDWKAFALFVAKVAVYFAGLALFGLTIFWLRRSLN